MRWIYVTCPDEQTASTIGRALVEERLAACVNILPTVRSIYRWEGNLVEDSEAILIAKTTAVLADAVRDRVVALHPFSCPCVLVFQPEGGHEPWLRWLADASVQEGEPGDPS